MYALPLLAIGLVPHSAIVEDSVDVVEINHLWDVAGTQEVFIQTIFWKWNEQRCDFEIIAWRIVRTSGQWPRKTPYGFTATWLDGDLLRQVRAKIRRETWSQIDVELRRRKLVPPHQRKGLTK